MSNKEVMQQALEALEQLDGIDTETECVTIDVGEVIDALRTALEQPDQEPVAWAVQGITQMIRGEFAELDAKSKAKRIGGTCVAYPLYTAPPQRSWVGLEPEEILDLFDRNNVYGSKWVEFARTVEAKLRNKNDH